MTDTEKLPDLHVSQDDAFHAAHMRFLRNRRRRIPLITLIFLPVVILSLYSAFLILRAQLTTGTTVAPTSTAVVVQLDQRMTAIEQKKQEMETRLGALETRSGGLVADATTPGAPPVNTQATTRLENDFSALSAAVSALQDGMKQAGSAATQIWQATQNRISASVAFIQLRTDADAGRRFADDMAALRTATAGDGAVQAPLAQLEPYAANGVPTLVALRENFARLQGPASTAVDKATAQNWREKLLAELGGLISIRPLHGVPATDALATIEGNLASGDPSAALETVKTLPPEAQDTLKDWREKVEARLAVDQALRSLAARLLTPEPVPVAPGDEP